MNSRERMAATLNHREPDRVPVDVGSIVTGITTGANDALKAHLGIVSADPVVDRIQQLAWPSEPILQRLRVDTRYLYLSASRDWQDIELPDNSYEDEFGVRRKAAFAADGRLLYYDFVGKPPLADAETVTDIAKFKWPDPHDAARYAGLEDAAREMYEATDYAVMANAIGSIMEFSWYLRGYMNFFSDLKTNPALVEALIDAMLEYQMALFDEILGRIGKYLSVVMIGSDLGTQRAPVMSEATYVKYILPRYRKFVRSIKAKTDARVFYHSCGSLYPLIKHLVDAGIDALHPVQPMAGGMGDRKKLKAEFGDRLTFWGGFDQQQVLPFGTPDQVRQETRKLLDDFMPGGDFVFAAGHNIQTGVPAENVLALFDAVFEHGVY